MAQHRAATSEGQECALTHTAQGSMDLFPFSCFEASLGSKRRVCCKPVVFSLLTLGCRMLYPLLVDYGVL